MAITNVNMATWAGHDHAQAFFAQAIVQAADGDRASHFRANGRTRPLNCDAEAAASIRLETHAVCVCVNGRSSCV